MSQKWSKEKYNEWRKEYRATKAPKYLIECAKANAKKRGLEFDLTEDDINIPDLCPVLGVPFKSRTRYSASLDRIDNNKGYIKGNIQIISWRANQMKSDASPEELRAFAKWVNEQTL